MFLTSQIEQRGKIHLLHPIISCETHCIVLNSNIIDMSKQYFAQLFYMYMSWPRLVCTMSDEIV